MAGQPSPTRTGLLLDSVVCEVAEGKGLHFFRIVELCARNHTRRNGNQTASDRIAIIYCGQSSDGTFLSFPTNEITMKLEAAERQTF
jgi:hypothetical protein